MPPRYGHHGQLAREGIYAHPIDASKPDGPLRWSFGPRGEQALHTFHEWIAAASREGCNIVVDHLTMIDPPVLQDAIWRMQGLPVLFVLLKPPFEVLEQRVATRTMGGKSSSALSGERMQIVRDRLDRLRPWFYDAAYVNLCCDLLIDTEQHAPGAVCQLIEDRLRAGPGVAFEQLRGRFSRPRSDSSP